MWQMVNPTAGMNAGYSAGYREKDKSEAGGDGQKEYYQWICHSSIVQYPSCLIEDDAGDGGDYKRNGAFLVAAVSIDKAEQNDEDYLEDCTYGVDDWRCGIESQHIVGCGDCNRMNVGALVTRKSAKAPISNPSQYVLAFMRVGIAVVQQQWWCRRLPGL